MIIHNLLLIVFDMLMTQAQQSSIWYASVCLLSYHAKISWKYVRLSHIVIIDGGHLLSIFSWRNTKILDAKNQALVITFIVVKYVSP